MDLEASPVSQVNKVNQCPETCLHKYYLNKQALQGLDSLLQVN
jgi:hypothetical protein